MTSFGSQEDGTWRLRVKVGLRVGQRVDMGGTGPGWIVDRIEYDAEAVHPVYWEDDQPPEITGPGHEIVTLRRP